MNMTNGDTIVAIIASAMVLALNFFAFRSDARAAGHDRNKLLQMAAIWVTIIVGLTLAIKFVSGQ